ncbi:type II secretion system F family protein [Oscillibacter hominis]|uniref:Type II secretion system F family protein n=1 Tax=Oscillibacter hominis TaxID=2763056 RepID=A0A7G9B6R1_9FIRM|nr:type II secretion system F family protein [Oscillibacter hominis]QNL45242.1 type II secretion system F family protein [Oscillibacter hominis]
MLTFKYRAISRDGAKVSGVVEAFDEYEAVAKIKENCTVVTKIAQVEQRENLLHREVLPPRRISEKTLAVVSSQFSILLGSGIPVVRAVELIARQTNDKALKKILTQVAGDVASGFGLAQSFESKGRGLPTTFIETVRSGEESGTLDVAFGRLKTYYDKSSRTKAKVKSAMAYPLFTIVVAVIVVAIIMVVAVPVFLSSFAAMGAEMPLPTRMLIGLSNFFTHYGLAALGLLAAAAIALKLYGQREKGRLLFARLHLHLPVLGKIAVLKSASQFANTMSTLLAAGLPVIRAVATTGKVMDNYCIASQVLRMVPGLEEGKQLGLCMKRCQYLPELLMEMTGVGEETGTMETTLEVVGSYYDNETELASQKALSLLEPVVICILALLVGFILLAVYAPMFAMYNGVM